jgi:hypothetical protein
MMVDNLDFEADDLLGLREMKSSGPFEPGAWVYSEYSALSGKVRKRRELVRHLLDQLLL